MQHLLRVISGPLAGAIYVLGRRTTVGRAGDSDIQVLHEGASRQHAKITLTPEGEVILLDLSSDNGTFVEGQRISQHRLQPGEVFRVMSSQFVYERLESSDLVTSAAFRHKVTSGDSLRQTATLRVSVAGFRSGPSMTRSAGLVRRHGPSSKARRAAATALSTSAAAPAAARATSRPEDGSNVGKVSPETAATHLPSM